MQVTVDRFGLNPCCSLSQKLLSFRCFDGIYFLSVLFFYTVSFPGKHIFKSGRWCFGSLAIAVSLSWLEPGQIEFTSISLIAAFFLPFARAFSFILLRNAMESFGKNS
uniref:Uncharacterized protein n=1 Tax=Caenorhabditis japonica TaxID=281687 RepID=A0A8R1E768_CAEJA